MITIEMPEPPEQELVLAPKDEEFRSDDADPAAREPLRRRISLGGPVHRRIAVSSTDDAELRHFLDIEAADSDFYLLHITCTLRPEAGEPFTEALIELDLAQSGATGEPIAWSMQPDRMVDAVEIARTVSLGPKLNILGVGLDLSAEQQRTVTKQEVFLEAMYELESTPSWSLWRTSSSELRGLQRFHLVVRTPKGSTVDGTVLVEAKVKRKRFGVIPYSAVFGDGPRPLKFRLGGGA